MANYPELSGKVVIVTGSVGNLGAAVVTTLAAQKARIVLVDRNPERLQSAVAQHGLSDADSLTATTDVTKKTDIEKLVASAVEKFGHIDGLINVAGGFKMGSPVHALDEETWDFMLNLNGRSVFLMSGAVAKSMIDHGVKGRIVTVASRSALSGAAQMSAYTASKSIALRLTESMAAELLDQGITVNAVLPSVIDTPQNRQGQPDADFSKWVSPESIADVIAFLLSDGARDISGASIPIYGRS